MFERRSSLESPTVPLTDESLLTWLSGPPVDSGVAVNEHTAMGVSAVYRAAALVSSVAASLPLHPYLSGSKTRVESPLLDNPHPDMTAYEMWRLTYLHRCLWGNAFLLKERDALNRIRWLIPVSPSRVVVEQVPRTDANPAGKRFRYTDDWSSERLLTPFEMLHLPGLGYDGVRGYSPVQVARQGIGLALAAERHGAKLFGSGSLLQGLLRTDQKLDQTQVDAMRARWRTFMAGPDNAHEVAVLGSGAEFQSLQMPNDDAQFLESRRFQVSEISRWFGVPPFLMMDTERSTSWGCLPGDALVFTTAGPKPIEQITPGDEVWSYTGAGMAPAKVTAFHETGHKPLLTIRTTARELRLTANHRLPVRRYFGQDAGRGRHECGWETVEISAGEVRPGDFLLIPHGLRDGDRTVAPNGRALTIGAMEFCGFYIGDGSLDKNRVELAHEVDGPHMPHYREVVEREFGVRPYTDKGRGTRSRFSSTEARSLLECGFTGKAHTKRVPPWVFRLTSELQLAFLRGYLDADGGIARGVISFASANRLLLEDIRHLCIGLGIPVGRVRPSRREGVTVIRGKSYHSRTKYVLNLSSTPFNARIGSNHPAKVAQLVDRPTERRLRYDAGWEGGLGITARTKRADLTPGGTWTIPDVRLQRVVSIEQGSVAVPVYDITVAEHAHYVADGVIVHNTGLEQQALGFVTFDLHPGWLAPTEHRITRELLPAGRYAKYALEGLLRGDSAARSAFYKVMRDTGAFSANDIRELEDRPPVEGGDDRLQPLNMAPLGSTPDPDEGTTGDDDEPAE